MSLHGGVRLEERDFATVARLVGELEITTAGRVREQLLRAVDNRHFGLVVDLTEVSYVDSAGINVLFELAERLSERQLRLVVVSPDDSVVQHALSIVNLAAACGLHRDEDAAVAEIRASMPDGHRD